MNSTANSFSIADAFAALGRTNVFPDVEILTERMRLRAYTEADIDAHAAIFDDGPARLWSDAPQMCTREHAHAWCTRMAHEIRTSGDGICWATEDRATGRLIGFAGFHRTDWDNRITDVSATEAAWAVGCGYATQALRAISHWVLTEQNFNRVQITAIAGNRAPRVVAATCGFVQEGIMRDARVHRSGVVDMALYSLVPSDLRRSPPPTYTVRKPSWCASQKLLI